MSSHRTKISWYFPVLAWMFISSVFSQQKTIIKKFENCPNESIQQLTKRFEQYKPHTTIQRSTSYLFPAKKTLFYQGVMQKDHQKIMQSISGNTYRYVLNIGFVSLLALLFIVLPPILTFKHRCKKSEGLKKKRQKLYTKFQLLSIGISAIIVSLITIGICSAIIKINQQYEPAYNDFHCSVDMISNQLIEGSEFKFTQFTSNHSLTNSNEMEMNGQTVRFKGLKFYSNQIQKFYKNLQKMIAIIKKKLHRSFSQNIDTTFRLFNKLKQTSQYFVKTSSDMDLYPKYVEPISSYKQQKRQLIYSTFKKVFGDFSMGNTIVGNYSSILQESKLTFKNIVKKSNNFWLNYQELSYKRIQQYLSESIIRSQSIKQNFRSLMLKSIDIPSLRQLTIASYVVLSFTIFFLILLILATALMLFKTKFQCRYPIFICLFTIWTIGLLHFGLAIAFTINNPTVFHSCQAIKQSLYSQSDFSRNIQYGFGKEQKDIVSKCLLNSTTPIFLYQNIFSRNVRQKWLKYRDFLQSDFNIDQINANLQNSFRLIMQSATKYINGMIVDVDRPNMLQQMQDLSKTSECIPDSWFINTPQKQYNFSCSLNRTQIANNQTCPTIAAFQAGSAGCIGCIDLFSMLRKFTDHQQLNKSLLTRYPFCQKQNKTQQVDRIVIFWRKYVSIKFRLYNNIQQVYRSIQKNNEQLQSQLNTVDQSVKSIKQMILNQPLLQQPHKQLLSQSMDCRIIGRSLERSRNILCSEAIAYTYYLKIFYTISSILILIICLLILWMLHRYKMQSYIKKNLNVQQQCKNDQNQIQFELNAVSDRKFGKNKIIRQQSKSIGEVMSPQTNTGLLSSKRISQSNKDNPSQKRHFQKQQIKLRLDSHLVKRMHKIEQTNNPVPQIQSANELQKQTKPQAKDNEDDQDQIVLQQIQFK